MFLVLKLFFQLLIGKNVFYVPYQAMEWHELYRDTCLDRATRRQLREDSLPYEWTDDVIAAAKKFWAYQCPVCGQTENLQKDHLVPIAHKKCPGAVPTNLLILCEACNWDKAAQDFATWYWYTFEKDPVSTIERIHQWQYYCYQRGWN